MRQNIGTVESMIRISGGLTLLAWSIAKMAREEPSAGNMLIAFAGAQKVAEGITYYCPVKDLLGIGQSHEKLTM